MLIRTQMNADKQGSALGGFADLKHLPRRWNAEIVGTFVSLGFLLGFTGVASAQMPEQSNQFRRIEQPVGLKAAVTLGGLGLIGAELWWFLFSKTRSQKADDSQGIQELTINVDGGYAPDRVVVKSGQPVRLNFLRKDPSSCLEKVLLPDFHIAQDLALNNITPIEFIPEKPGQYQFTCGMNMFRGVVEVQ